MVSSKEMHDVQDVYVTYSFALQFKFCDFSDINDSSKTNYV